MAARTDRRQPGLDVMAHSTDRGAEPASRLAQFTRWSAPLCAPGTASMRRYVYHRHDLADLAVQQPGVQPVIQSSPKHPRRS